MTVAQANPIGVQAREDSAAGEYARGRRAHWDAVARRSDGWRGAGGYYHRRLEAVHRFVIPAGLRVLEVGCGRGDLLASLGARRAVGVDFSAEMIERARAAHRDVTFIEADAHALELDESFDAIILSDLVNDLWDVQGVFERVRAHCLPHTRVILNFYSRLWELPLSIAPRMKLALAKPKIQNWLTVPDVSNLLRLAGLEPLRHWEEVLMPLGIPIMAPLCNRVLVRTWPLKHLALTNLMVARPAPMRECDPPPVVSVIVPARNESGNIESIFQRTPSMGAGTELVFVEGHSTDDTFAAIERAASARAQDRVQVLKQPGRGKGDAVRAGFAAARGEVLMILDADLTVPPEDLPRFYHAWRSGQGEFINGVRLVYPMEKQAMRPLNLLGNKFFSWAFSWLLGQPIKDTLCGTKVLSRSDYQRLIAGRAYFGEFDPFGDFDLVFGAAKLNLKIVDLPVRYRARTYGSTNIHRWRHGWLLLKMVAFAARRIKFI